MVTEPETHSWIIIKRLRPEHVSESYRDSLGILAHPDSYEEIATSLDLVIERRDLVEGEPEEIDSRGHIYSVHPDSPVTVPPGPASALGEALTHGASAAQARAHHGLDKAHERGHRGKGRTCAVLDTGVDEVWASRLGSRLIAKESLISGEDYRDTDSGHGTHCIGTIAEGAPESSLVSIKVLSTKTGSGSYSGIIKGISRAVELGATEINQSLGGEGSPDDPIAVAVNAAAAKGVLMPCAAGNSQRGTQVYTADSQSPGCAASAICCGAGDLSGNMADFSSWGLSVDARAIGVAVDSWGLRGGRASLSGTSMATPYLCACCAVVAGASDSANARDALYKTAKDYPGVPAYKEGAGVVRADAALDSLFSCGDAPSLSEAMKEFWKSKKAYRLCKERA